MGYKQAEDCKRCGLTTTYTNAVEHALWQSRDGCPACHKPAKEQDGKQPAQVEAPESFAALAKWYDGEINALTHLMVLGVISDGERQTIVDELQDTVRGMVGLDP